MPIHRIRVSYRPRNWIGRRAYTKAAACDAAPWHRELITRNCAPSSPRWDAAPGQQRGAENSDASVAR